MDRKDEEKDGESDPLFYTVCRVFSCVLGAAVSLRDVHEFPKGFTYKGRSRICGTGELQGIV